MPASEAKGLRLVGDYSLIDWIGSQRVISSKAFIPLHSPSYIPFPFLRSCSFAPLLWYLYVPSPFLSRCFPGDWLPDLRLAGKCFPIVYLAWSRGNALWNIGLLACKEKSDNLFLSCRQINVDNLRPLARLFVLPLSDTKQKTNKTKWRRHLHNTT